MEGPLGGDLRAGDGSTLRWDWLVGHPRQAASPNECPGCCHDSAARASAPPLVQIKIDRESNDLRASVEKAKNDVYKSIFAIMGVSMLGERMRRDLGPFRCSGGGQWNSTPPTTQAFATKIRPPRMPRRPSPRSPSPFLDSCR